MKTIMKYGLALFLSIGVSNACLAVLINDPTAGVSLDGTDVGTVDTVMMTAFLVPGSDLGFMTLPDADPTTEDAWANMVLSVLGIDTTGLSRLSTSVAPAVYMTDTDGVYASNIATDPAAIADYFVVNNGSQWALFTNNANTDWAVFNVATVLPDTLNIDDLNVSHIALFSNSSASISEPSALALLGLGLLGIGLASRRKSRIS